MPYEIPQLDEYMYIYMRVISYEPLTMPGMQWKSWINLAVAHEKKVDF